MSEATQKNDFVLPIEIPKIERTGTDVTIVSLSRSSGNQFLVAAENLQKKYGVNTEVINLSCVKPLDVETMIHSVKKTRNLVEVSVESGLQDNDAVWVRYAGTTMRDVLPSGSVSPDSSLCTEMRCHFRDIGFGHGALGTPAQVCCPIPPLR
jgi:hypothetical protein